MRTCIGCKYHSREIHLLGMLFADYCGLDGRYVGLECPIGCIDTRGCSAYERRPAWPEGAIA